MMMDRRDFLKRSATGVSVVAAAGLVGLPAMAAATRRMTHNKSDMRKIIIIDGGPRRNMNTAGMLQAFAEGAESAGKDVEVKTVRLSWKRLPRPMGLCWALRSTSVT